MWQRQIIQSSCHFCMKAKWQGLLTFGKYSKTMESYTNCSSGFWTKVCKTKPGYHDKVTTTKALAISSSNFKAVFAMLKLDRLFTWVYRALFTIFLSTKSKYYNIKKKNSYFGMWGKFWMHKVVQKPSWHHLLAISSHHDSGLG